MELEVQRNPDDDTIQIVFKDTGPKKDIILETKVEPDSDKVVEMSLAKDGQVSLKSITFDGNLYTVSEVQKTADKIKQRFDAEGCKPCIALSEASGTKKTFVLPFLTVLKDLVEMDLNNA